MSPLTPSPLLRLSSSLGAHARVRLHCGKRQIWDDWVPAAGAISCPALAPERITLSASLTETTTRVSRKAVLRNAPACGCYAVSLRQDRGARLLLLDATCGDGRDHIAGLILSNTTRMAMDYTLDIDGSPYGISGYLQPGTSLAEAWTGPLSLEVIVEGRSFCLPLVTAEGAWHIEASTEPAGFRVTAIDTAPLPRSFV